jgi:hypothetical protein
MSSENENPQQDTSSDGNGADLATTLAGGETEFVATEEKKNHNQLIYLLLVVALGAGGTYLMYKRQGPDSAKAASPDAAKAAQTINEFLSTGPGGIEKMQEMLKNTEKVVQQFQEYPSTNQVPLSELQTNPFKFASDKPPSAKDDEDELAKKRELEKQAAIKACATLHLQSIIHSGSRKSCMINNTLYLEGQQVDQFIVEKIEAGRVIVKSGAYRFELKMQK